MLDILSAPFGFLEGLINIFTRDVEESTPIFEVTLPSNVLHRTELICKYISSEKKVDFEVENFLMLLYLDFIKGAVKNYNPKKIYTQLTTEYYEKRTICLISGDESFEIDKCNMKTTTLEISMDREDVSKGELILDELYDLYRVRISFNRLLESLWIGFIESYKKGENSRAYASIVKILKETLG